MDVKDVVFKTIPANEVADPNSFCHYGWEGTGAFAFWRYATAYFDSAEVLYEKFVSSPGENAILDGIGITMCFLYRHFVELSVKHLYVKFVCSTEDEYKEILGIGHNLYDLWHATKPKLSALKKRVGSSVDVGILEHYIMEFDRFDKDSMTMRYPVKKDLKPMNGSTRLDIHNLHERVNELYWAFEGLASDLDNQLSIEMDQFRIDEFLGKYEELRPRTLWLLEAMKPFAEKENHGLKGFSISELVPSVNDGIDQRTLLLRCKDDELIMFDALYYAGRAVDDGLLNLPKNPYEARTDVIKMCIMNMDRDHLEFGKPRNNEICVHEKMASSIIQYVSRAVAVIDWGKH